MKRNVSVTIVLLLSILLSLLLAGCGGEKTPAVASSAAPAATSAAPAASSQAAAPAASDEDEEEEEEDGEFYIEYDIDMLADNLTGAYGGILETGEFVGFGANDDGSLAMMLFFSTKEHVTFVGPAVVNENFVSIADEVNGMEVTFEVLYGDDGGLIIDLGDLGGGVLAAITVDELLDTFVAVLEGTYSLG